MKFPGRHQEKQSLIEVKEPEFHQIKEKNSAEEVQNTYQFLAIKCPKTLEIYQNKRASKYNKIKLKKYLTFSNYHQILKYRTSQT